MKNNFIYNICLFLMLTCTAGVVLTSCKDEFEVERGGEFGDADYTTLQALITDVETYLSTAIEGINAGDHPPGSIEIFEQVLVDAKAVISKGMNEAITTQAQTNLNTEFEAFKTNVVGPANPWIQPVWGNYIHISDNIEGEGTEGSLQTLTNGGFTIETKVFPASLQQSGYSNVLFSKAQGGGGANDRGFNVRYFDDGHIEFIVGGTADGWKQGTTAAGVLSAGKWNHVSLVVENDHQALYVDGVEVAAQDEVYVNSDADFPITLGNSYAWRERPINGMVKDFRIWSKALSVSEVGTYMDTELIGDEAGLNVFFALSANLGSEHEDGTGKFLASFIGDNVIWVENGDLSGIEVDYSALSTALSIAEGIINDGNEGTVDGNYPVGTKAFLQSLVDEGAALIVDEASQLDTDNFTSNFEDILVKVEANVVADSEGIFVNGEDGEFGALEIVPRFNASGDFTIEMEVKLETLLSGLGDAYVLATDSYLFGVTRYSSGDNTEEVIASGSMLFYVRNGWGYSVIQSDPLTITAGAWYHFAATFDNATGTYTAFLDGNVIGSMTGLNVPDDFGWGELYLGAAKHWGDPGVNGNMRDLRIWTEARSPSDLDATINGSEPNLELYLPLDKVAGVIFNDETGNYEARLDGDAIWDID